MQFVPLFGLCSFLKTSSIPIILFMFFVTQIYSSELAKRLSLRHKYAYGAAFHGSADISLTPRTHEVQRSLPLLNRSADAGKRWIPEKKRGKKSKWNDKISRYLLIECAVIFWVTYLMIEWINKYCATSLYDVLNSAFTFLFDFCVLGLC